MTDRAIEPPRRREPDGKTRVAALEAASMERRAGERRQTIGRDGLTAEPRPVATVATITFLALVEGLPSDYYLG